MKFISHRGNYCQKNIDTENKINQIDKCLNIGLDVEIDVWYHNNKWLLGHDKPQYSIDEKFLCNPKLWCHAKNYLALLHMSDNADIHFFWHNIDKYTLTSKNYIWAYPGEKIDKNTICVLPELSNYNDTDLKTCAGICSDFIIKYIS